MNSSRLRRPQAASFLVACAALFVTSLPQADDPAGDLWEVVSQMSVEGMPFAMPAQTLKVCSAHDWTHPPGGNNDDRGCTSSNMAVDGDTVTWDSTCEDGMTGTGTITREGDDAYHGEIRYNSDEGDIVIKLTGHRIGGCDHPQ
jgi:Protein of unknown function (DUF3617)